MRDYDNGRADDPEQWEARQSKRKPDAGRDIYISDKDHADRKADGESYRSKYLDSREYMQEVIEILGGRR